MSAQIRIAGVEATVDDELRWKVTRVDGAQLLGETTSPEFARSLERLLNTAYGLDWLPDFGIYEPDFPNAVAQAVARDLGAEVLEPEPVEEDTLEGRVY